MYGSYDIRKLEKGALFRMSEIFWQVDGTFIRATPSLICRITSAWMAKEELGFEFDE